MRNSPGPIPLRLFYTNISSGTPKGEDIDRFISIIVNRIKPTSRQVPSYGAIRGGLRRLVDELIFKYDDFKISPLESKSEELLRGKATVGIW